MGCVWYQFYHRRAGVSAPKGLNSRYPEFAVPAYYSRFTTVVVVGTGAIEVKGEVMHPGLYDYTKRVTVLRAIKIAGGFTSQASHKVRLVRESRSLTVNCDKAGRDPRLDLEVFPGNVIQIPKR